MDEFNILNLFIVSFYFLINKGSDSSRFVISLQIMQSNFKSFCVLELICRWGDFPLFNAYFLLYRRNTCLW